MNILMVLTSHDRLGDTGKKTGFWLEEFAAPYYVLKDVGHTVTLASPHGGQPPLDPKSDEPEAQTEATRRFKSDRDAQSELATTHRLADAAIRDFDAVFYPGGHGPLWDLVDDVTSQRLIASAIEAGKPVALVCHAPAVLKDVALGDGTLLVTDRKVTGFTNEEEEAVGLTDIGPFLLEDVLKEKGAHFSKGGTFQPYVVTDGLLITGQNPQSSEPAAEALLKALESVEEQAPLEPSFG
jgi:putative intracellular protease/amidase